MDPSVLETEVGPVQGLEKALGNKRRGESMALTKPHAPANTWAHEQQGWGGDANHLAGGHPG
jgi:hypothetical protein